MFFSGWVLAGRRLRRGAGLSAFDKAADPIPCEHQESTGLATYAIAPWAVEAARQLVALGFTCRRMTFGEIENLYARYGMARPNLCFAGHTDVVPVGDAPNGRVRRNTRVSVWFLGISRVVPKSPRTVIGMACSSISTMCMPS